MFENGREENEGVVAQVIRQTVSHVQNILLYHTLKRLLTPNDDPNLWLNEGKEILLAPPANTRSINSTKNCIAYTEPDMA